MCDDLIKELDSVLKPDKADKINKLQNYFDVENDNDDLFESIIKDTNIQNYPPSSSENRDIIQQSEVCFDDFNVLSQKSRKRINADNVWLSSDKTKNFLAKIVSRNSLSVTADSSIVLARPQLHTNPNQRLPDPIFTLLQENCGMTTAVEMRQIPVIEELPLSIIEVLNLVSKGWLRPSIDLISKLLEKIGFQYAKNNTLESITARITHESCQLWCLRFALMLRVKLFHVLEVELSGFHDMDCPNLYGEYYTDCGDRPVRGSLVPFSMRLIHAELPLYFNKFNESLGRLYYLLAVIRRILINLQSGFSEDGTTLYSNSDLKQDLIKLWERRELRVLISCIRVLIVSKDYPSAIDIINSIIRSSSDSRLNDVFYQLIARIYLHIGDLNTSVSYFEESLSVFKLQVDKSETGADSKSYATVQFRISFQDGLIHMSRNNFDDAKRSFKECLDINPNNLAVLNNYSVCCLYLKQVQEAIDVYEGLLQHGVRHDALIFNLCILYELQTTQMKLKKVKVVKTLAKYPGDDFNIASFKLINPE